MSKATKTKKAVSLEVFIFLAVIIAFFGLIGAKMGGVNMMQTMMNTAYQLLLETVFYIMAIAVIAGAVSGLFSEFGLIALINKIISPLMKPVYDLPGAASMGVLTTYLSDNPAILGLAEDTNFKKYFKKYQLPALTNLGGMGLIVTTSMIGITSPTGENLGFAALIGNIGAIIGSVVSVRMMIWFTKKEYGTTEYCIPLEEGSEKDVFEQREIRDGGIGARALEALLDGGKNGVDVGLAIIPGVLAICTVVMMLTNGPSADGVYTGAAYEGVALLPWIGEKLQFILSPLFGFSSPSAISVPITALGAAGAAVGLIPKMVADGVAHANDVAVFTAMCMCWSGYLSTHVAMMSSLKCSKLTGKAIISHTIGGIVAGIAANWLFQLASFIM